MDKRHRQSSAKKIIHHDTIALYDGPLGEGDRPTKFMTDVKRDGGGTM